MRANGYHSSQINSQLATEIFRGAFSSKLLAKRKLCNTSGISSLNPLDWYFQSFSYYCATETLLCSTAPGYCSFSKLGVLVSCTSLLLDIFCRSYAESNKLLLELVLKLADRLLFRELLFFARNSLL